MAASRDLGAQLAKQPPAKKAAILAAVLAGLGLLYWQFYYSGLKETRDSAKSARSRLQSQQRKLDEDVTRMKELRAEHEELKKGIDAIQLALPTEAELPSFVDHLQVKAGDAGVNFVHWDLAKEIPVEEYMKVAMEVVVTGNFYQIMHYFFLLSPAITDKEQKAGERDSGSGSRRPAERIVTVENLRLGDMAVEGEDIILTARFTASTFRKEAEIDQDAGEPEKSAKPKGGVGKVKDARKAREDAVEKTSKSGEGAGDRGTTLLKNPGAGADLPQN